MAKNEIADLVVSFAAACDAFSQLLELENAAIRGRDIAKVASLSSEKTAAAHNCETAMAALRQASADLSRLDKSERHGLRTLQANLTQLIDENVRLLEVAVDVGRRVMDAAATAAKEAAPGPGVYGQDGALGQERSRGTPTSLSVSFDQSL